MRFLHIRFVAQRDQPRRDARHSRDAFGVRGVERAIVLGLSFFEGNRHRDNAAVKLRNRDVDRRLKRIQSAGRKLPRRLRDARRHGLKNGDVEAL